LNFGNPEHAEVMWQFGEVVEGMSEACEALGIPVIGGNVSFYNTSNGDDIDPTPVVGVLGLIDELRAAPPRPALFEGNAVIIIGDVQPELGGSEWAAVVHGLDGGRPPAVDLGTARATHGLVAELARDGAVAGIHDVSDGGLAVALAEMAINGACGAQVTLEFDDCTPAEACFAESASVFVTSVAPDRVDDVLLRATNANVRARIVGSSRGERLVAHGAFDVSVADAADTWRNAIPRLMSAG
jgi:phosphoribosylformylglycinamidine synthase